MASAGELLESKDFTVLVDPSKAEARRSSRFKERTVVLRPSHSKEPPARLYAGIEKLLVDLRIEVDSLMLMDLREFQALANEIARSGRIRLASLIRYAEARQLSADGLFGSEESTNAKF